VTESLLVLPLAHDKVIGLNKEYLLGRKRHSLAKAREARSAEARLIHFELAGRYSVQAASCEPVDQGQIDHDHR
jgi:hypothetical protein